LGESKTIMRYDSFSREKVLPTISLSNNSDGSITGRTNFTVTWDGLTRPNTDKQVYKDQQVFNISVGPAFSFTDNSKSGLLSVGTKSGASSATTSSGTTSISGGILFGGALLAPISTAEVVKGFEALAPFKADAVAKCQIICNQPIQNCGGLKDSAKEICETGNTAIKYIIHVQSNGFCDPASPTHKAPNLPAANYSYIELCSDGQKVYSDKGSSTLKAIEKEQRDRFRFPVIELTGWVGGGASQFSYYQQQTASTSTSTASYASLNTWKPNWGTALLLTANPTTNNSYGLTLELPIFLKAGYQASKNTGSVFTSVGTVNNASLSSSTPAQPIGEPSYGLDLNIEGYIGFVERDNGYWRMAIGGGLDRNFLTSQNTWSIKIPLYVNGTALGGAGNTDKSTSTTSATSPVKVGYDGIFRLTPTFQYVTNPAQGPNWTFLLTFELLGQKILFSKADNLVK
jgi:hypothetical protein